MARLRSGHAHRRKYPLITVSDLPASRAFFVERLGMRVIFEATWVVMLAQEGDDSIRLGLQIEPAPGFWIPYV